MPKSCLIPSIATIVMLFSALQSNASIVSGPISFSGHNYYVLSKNSWTASEAEAVTLGGHLVTVNNAAENQFLIDDIILALGHSLDPLWIGLNDAASEGSFVWASGEAVTYTNWKVGEPNDFGGNEDYTAFNWQFARFGGGARDWNDTPVGGSFGFEGNSNGPYFGIAEVNTGAVPEPTTLIVWSMMGMLAMIGLTTKKWFAPHRFVGG